MVARLRRRLVLGQTVAVAVLLRGREHRATDLGAAALEALLAELGDGAVVVRRTALAAVLAPQP